MTKLNLIPNEDSSQAIVTQLEAQVTAQQAMDQNHKEILDEVKQLHISMHVELATLANKDNDSDKVLKLLNH